MRYTLERNGKIVRQIVLVGKDINHKKPNVVDLTFETYESALEVAEVLKAEVVDNQSTLAA